MDESKEPDRKQKKKPDKEKDGVLRWAGDYTDELIKNWDKIPD